MNCPMCGHINKGASNFCEHCGASLKEAKREQQSAESGSASGASSQSYSQASYQQQEYQQQEYQQQEYQPQYNPSEYKAMPAGIGTVPKVLGIIGLVFALNPFSMFWGILLPVTGLVLIQLEVSRGNEDVKQYRKINIIAIIVNIFTTVLASVLGILLYSLPSLFVFFH